MREPWRTALYVLLYGWMPAGIGWQLLHVERLDAYSMLGWFLWPAVPIGYVLQAFVRRWLGSVRD